MALDTQPWMRVLRTQAEWVARFNEEGGIMASAPDLYAAIKELDDAGMASLREDFAYGLVLSTRVQRDPGTLEGKIVHYVGSAVTAPAETCLTIPHFSGTSIEEAILNGKETVQGLAYLQAYFGTQDSAEEIIGNLARVSGKPKENIGVWVECGAAVVGFELGDGFYVSGSGFDLSIGRSRRVAR